MMKTRTIKRAGAFLFGLPALSLCTVLLPSFPSAKAAQPVIEYVDTYPNNRVRIHFNTDAKRTYVVQYVNSWSSNIATTNWSNLYTVLAYPTSNHWIIQDVRTTPFRFYRLKATP